MKRMFPGATPMLAALSMLATAAHAAPACPAPVPRQLVETFISADCETCWQQRIDVGAGTLRLDWVVPGAQGDDAPLAVAALPEAGERLKSPLAKDAAAVQAHAATRPPAGLKITANSGLAWNGYIALVLDLQQRNAKALTPQAVGWVALVERVPAGEDGSPEDRQLVRNVIGPLPLALPKGQHELRHLRAVRLPANVKVERLGAVGWIEDGDHIVALTQSPNCVPASQ